MLVLVLQKGIGQFPYHKRFDEKLSIVAKNTEQREYVLWKSVDLKLFFAKSVEVILQRLQYWDGICHIQAKKACFGKVYHVKNIPVYIG